jgi:dsRNA-specific ribonuclease
MVESDKRQGNGRQFDSLNGPSGFRNEAGPRPDVKVDFKMQLEMELSPYSCGKFVYESHDSVQKDGTKGIRCTLKVSGRRVGEGFALSKEEAEQRAAQDALKAYHEGAIKFKHKR